VYVQVYPMQGPSFVRRSSGVYLPAYEHEVNVGKRLVNDGLESLTSGDPLAYDGQARRQHGGCMMVVGEDPLRGRIRKDIEVLVTEFNGVFPREAIERFAQEYATQFEGARITEFVPLLVYKGTRERLRATLIRST
jgi:hypothetical protein